MAEENRQRESLKDETMTAIEEARMVLPGIQALFGFQMIAVFNERFHSLTASAQLLHLSAITLVALAITLVMTPAAYHRIAERGWVSRALIDVTSNYLTAGMVALMIGLSVDLGLVATIILNSVSEGTAIGAFMFLICAACWIVVPMRHRIKVRAR